MKHLILALLLISCATGTQQAPVSAVTLNKSWPNEDWQAYAYEKAATLPLTADGVEWCPKGMSRENYTHLLAAMVKSESNFRPDLEYRESFKDQKGNYIISTGLLQLSVESARGYGFYLTQDQLKDPKVNIELGVAILKKWLERDGVIATKTGTTWRGAARYWSVMRHSRWDSKAKKWVPNSAHKAVKDYLGKFCQ